MAGCNAALRYTPRVGAPEQHGSVLPWLFPAHDDLHDHALHATKTPFAQEGYDALFQAFLEAAVLAPLMVSRLGST